MQLLLVDLLALVPLILVIAFWIYRYRLETLRIRTMAVTAGIAAFVALNLDPAIRLLTGDASERTSELLITNLIVSVLFGATFLLWWPLLGKNLRKIGIRW